MEFSEQKQDKFIAQEDESYSESSAQHSLRSGEPEDDMEDGNSESAHEYRAKPEIELSPDGRFKKVGILLIPA